MNILILSYSIIEDTQEQVVKIKSSTYNKERYEANKDYLDTSQGSLCFLN